MKYLKGFFLVIIIFISISFKPQTAKELILGDWIEVRRETRLGYIFNPGGAQNVPSIEISFFKDNSGTYYDREGISMDANGNMSRPPKSKFNYTLEGENIIFSSVCEIVKLDRDNLVYINQLFSRKDDHDLKCYFIHKEAYDKLSSTERDKLKGPTQKDLDYRDANKKKGPSQKELDYRKKMIFNK